MRSRKHLTKVKYFFTKQELAVVTMVGDVVCGVWCGEEGI